jgi:hypothetical protein
MPKRLAGAQEFLDYVRSVSSHPMRTIQSGPNLEFQRLYETKVQQLPEADALRFANPVADPIDYIARTLCQDLLTVLPANWVAPIKDSLVVGALDNISVNAACLRSDEGFLVVVINKGLMALFNKVSKIMVSSVVPGSVEYCNRCPAKDVTSSLARTVQAPLQSGVQRLHKLSLENSCESHNGFLNRC